MKQRNHVFDFLCGLCIIRMIMLHTISMCGYRSEFWFGKLMAWTFFFMSFFFFKAGYFNKGVKGEFIPYLRDRAKRLLIPYLSWGAIGSAIFFGFIYCVPRLHFMADKLHWNHVYKCSHFWGNPPLWFLFSFFTTYILMRILSPTQYLPVLTKIVDSRFFSKLRIGIWLKPLLFLSFPFISYYLFKQKNPLWMSLNNIFMGMFFFQLGHWWRLFTTGKYSFMNRRTQIAASIACILLFIVSNKLLHGEYDMSLNKFVGNPWGAGLNTTLALVGISGLLLALPQKRVPIINFIGEHSMVFFVLHYPLIIFYRNLHLAFSHTVRGHWEDFIILKSATVTDKGGLTSLVQNQVWTFINTRGFNG